MQVGPEIEHRTIVIDEPVARIELIQQADHLAVELGSIRLAEVHVVHPVPLVRPVPHIHDRVTPVLGDERPEAPLGLVGPFVDQLIFRLIAAEPVVVQLLVAVRFFVGVTFRRLRVAGIEEAGTIVGPGGAGELDPTQMIVQVPLGLDIPHEELAPVGAARGNAVDERLAVLGEVEYTGGDGTILRELVGVEQQLGLGIQARLHVEDRLVLQPVVLPVEVVIPFLPRRTVTLVVPDLGEPFSDPIALGNRLEVSERHLVLRHDPRLGLFGVDVFEPAVGVGDDGPVVVVCVIDSLGLRVLDLRLHRHRDDQG